MTNDNSRKIKQNRISLCILPWYLEYSRLVVFGEDRLRERGSLPATFYVLSRAVFLMTNYNCHTFKQNQIFCCVRSWIVENWRSIDFGEDRLRGKGSLPATFYVLTRVKYLIFIKYPEKKAIIIHWRKVDEISINEKGSWKGRCNFL